ncbi:MAG: cytochrome c3 family protein [Armatimonadetes bacterium]|nr:MAG: cytochrome C [Armatimonadota bacterium]MCE7900676.1 cytochrome C [Armatimonadetes bacterium ATM1]MDL1928556.1 cytochrome C [Fimbriimonadia bacterium ATM]MBC6970038.1 cytochrome C [Armatimonadota bacterium]MBL1149607.1 cytochrome C [Armatimonadota bacterium]
MPQVFGKGSNVLVKVTLIGGGLLLFTVVMVGMYMTPYTHDLGIAFDQPAPFSHKHHFEQLGIHCKYCHTQVEDARFAGVPATETCMTCHSQIWTNSPLLEPVRSSYAKGEPIRWNRITNAPDFVYFNHSVHIAKGVSCFTCHGRVDQMNLMYKENAFEMKWCLNCHRNPEQFVRPKAEIYNPNYAPSQDHAALGRELVKTLGIEKEQIQNCSVCHR